MSGHLGEDVDCASRPWLEVKRRIELLLSTYQDVNVSLTNTQGELGTFKGVSYAYKFSIVVLASAYFTLRLLCELKMVYRDHNLQIPPVLRDIPQRTQWPNLKNTVYEQKGFDEYVSCAKRDDIKFQYNKDVFSNIVDARHQLAHRGELSMGTYPQYMECSVEDIYGAFCSADDYLTDVLGVFRRFLKDDSVGRSQDLHSK